MTAMITLTLKTTTTLKTTITLIDVAGQIAIADLRTAVLSQQMFLAAPLPECSLCQHATQATGCNSSNCRVVGVESTDDQDEHGSNMSPWQLSDSAFMPE